MTKDNPSTKKRILVVEDDARFSEAIKVILSTSGFDVQVASAAQEGCNLALSQPFDLIISDVRMPGMTGIDLLQILKKEIKTPIVLMTGFSEISETKEAYALGAAGFIKKPFGRKDLLGMIASIFPLESTGASPKQADDPNDYCSVKIEDFVSGKDIQYDIFLKLGASNFVKIANSGENLNVDQIKVYKSKGVEVLYLKKEDFRKYVKFTIHLNERAKNSEKITQGKKVTLSKHVTELLMEQYFLEGVNEESFKTSVGVVQTNMEVVDKDNDARSLLESLNSHGNHLFAHSTGVSLYAVMIAQNLGWKAESTLTKVSLGGLFHDIGKKNIDRRILDQSRTLHSFEESKTYESHVEIGVQLLSPIPLMNSEVLMIVQQHHEKANAYGFPSRLNSRQIFPLAKVVGLSNVFCNLVIKNPSCQGFSVNEALKRLNTISAEQFDSEFILALNRIFDYQHR